MTKIEKYPISKFKNNWPFTLGLAKDLFVGYTYSGYSSFKNFLILTSRVEEESFLGLVVDDDELEREAFNYDLIYQDFFISDKKVFFKGFLDENSNDIEKSEYGTYSLDHIPYQTILLAAIKCYVHNFLDQTISNESTIDSKRSSLYTKRNSMFFIWTKVFKYLLFTKYFLSVKKIIHEKNYFEPFKLEVSTCFASQFKEVEKEKELMLNPLLSLKKEVLEKRLLNLLTFSNISQTEAETLITNFFSTRSFTEIISYYEGNYLK